MIFFFKDEFVLYICILLYECLSVADVKGYDSKKNKKRQR